MAGTSCCTHRRCQLAERIHDLRNGLDRLGDLAQIIERPFDCRIATLNPSCRRLLRVRRIEIGANENFRLLEYSG